MKRFVLSFAAAMLVPISASADAIDDQIEKIAKSMGGNNGVERDDNRKGRPVVVVKMQLARRIPVDVCKQLGQLKNVQKIWFTGSPVTDDGVKELIPLANTLTLLDLNGSKITSESLKSLSQLKNLTSLAITDTAISDDNLKELQNLKKLTHLYLSRTKITDACYDDVAGIKSLKELYVVECRLPKDAVAELKKRMPKSAVIR